MIAFRNTKSINFQCDIVQMYILIYYSRSVLQHQYQTLFNYA